MSSSLERLKALTSKLEEKIAEKKSAEGIAPKAEKRDVQVEQTPYADIKIEQAPVQNTEEKSDTEPVTTVLEDTVIVPEKNKSSIREENIDRVHILYDELGISEKCPDFDMLFLYKAMNLSGIGLKEEDFGVIREGKYVQIIAITYEPDKTGKKKAKNISMGYFGKGESIKGELKNKIIEFVLRWRYEKAFQNVEHYKNLIGRLDKPKTLF